MFSTWGGITFCFIQTYMFNLLKSNRNNNNTNKDIIILDVPFIILYLPVLSV